MRERPIIFSTPMVKAILEGRKTQTRRIVKPTKDKFFGCELSPCELSGEINWGDHINSFYGTVGDILWVRENWRVSKKHDSVRPIDLPFDRGLTIAYAAGGSRAHNGDGIYVNDDNYPQEVPDWLGKIRPSIHIPRSAARIFLEVTDVRIEKLQDISEADAIAEGIEDRYGSDHCRWRIYGKADTFTSAPESSYESLWESINGAGSWDLNPFVWVISFKRIVL